jgi:hypothetical protein
MKRDSLQLCSKRARRQYALGRLRVATDRLMVAESSVEKARATHWVIAWAGLIGALHFHDLGKELRENKPRQ